MQMPAAVLLPPHARGGTVHSMSWRGRESCSSCAKLTKGGTVAAALLAPLRAHTQWIRSATTTLQPRGTLPSSGSPSTATASMEDTRARTRSLPTSTPAAGTLGQSPATRRCSRRLALCTITTRRPSLLIRWVVSAPSRILPSAVRSTATAARATSSSTAAAPATMRVGGCATTLTVPATLLTTATMTTRPKTAPEQTHRPALRRARHRQPRPLPHP